ncbi:type II toxin-antitoxin system VapC family toxin [Candidatus Bathyarchaeota archaeon]|nr:type II toxin-antitoxin system VapC family toxin [Candidatus Bathyarchaeota archaeon]
MSYILDSSAIFKTIKEGDVETLLGNHTIDLARYELGNTVWKQHVLHKKLSNDESRRLVRLIKEVLSIMEVSGIGCREEEILSIAQELHLTFYDSSYVLYSKEKNLPLVTEDETITEKAKPHIKVLKTSDLKVSRHV